MTVNDVMEVMDSWANPDWAYSWDKAGLATGDPGATVTKILTALTVTTEVLQVAKRRKVEMIVSHHPVIWEPIETLRLDRPMNRLFTELVKNDIACYSAHTNLDVACGGVNHILANRLSLKNISPLFPAPHDHMLKLVTFVPESHLDVVRNAISEAGAGEIGEYTHCSFTTQGIGTFKPGEAAKPYSGNRKILNEVQEYRLESLIPKVKSSAILGALFDSHPYEEVAYDLVSLENTNTTLSLGLRGDLPRTISLKSFSGQVRDSLGIEHVRFSGDPKAKVRHVAVMGGAGGASATRVPAGVDVFVTGDVKYHDALDAREGGLNIIDAGHHGTEKWIVPAMTDQLKGSLKGIKVYGYMENDPFQIV